MIKLRGFEKVLTLSLKIVTGMLNWPEVFPLFNWDISLCSSLLLAGLDGNEFNELFLWKFLKGLL